MKIRPMETELFRADRRTDRMKLISRFSQSPNTPKESTKITGAQANRQPFVSDSLTVLRVPKTHKAERIGMRVTFNPNCVGELVVMDVPWLGSMAYTQQNWYQVFYCGWWFAVDCRDSFNTLIKLLK